jgi:hypothetical protein
MGAYMNGMQVLYEKVRTLESLTPTRRQSAEVPENTSKVSGKSILVAEAVGRSALVVAYNQINETGLVGRFLDTRLGRDRNNPDAGLRKGGVNSIERLAVLQGWGHHRLRISGLEVFLHTMRRVMKYQKLLLKGNIFGVA